MKKKYLKWLLPIVLLLGLAAAFVVENVLPYAGIMPMRRSLEDLKFLLPKGTMPEQYGLKVTPFSIQTPDTVTLDAWYAASNTDTTKAIIVLLHGISACKEIEMERASLLASQGYASVLLDLRAHGKSGGKYCTFGYYEKYDLKAVADTLAVRYPNLPLGIWGASLGGAIALQAMALEERYQFGIIESTFDEFPKVAKEYGADWLFGLRSDWLTHRVLTKSAQIAQFDPFSVKPVEAARRIQRPVFFMHGDKDARIPMWFGRLNYEACPAPGKRWFQVPGAGHNNLWRVAGDTLRTQVWDFLEHRE